MPGHLIATNSDTMFNSRKYLVKCGGGVKVREKSDTEVRRLEADVCCRKHHYNTGQHHCSLVRAVLTQTHTVDSSRDLFYTFILWS